MTSGMCLVELIVSITLLAPVHRSPAANAVLTIVRSAMSGSPAALDQTIEYSLRKAAASGVLALRLGLERGSTQPPPPGRRKQMHPRQVPCFLGPAEFVRFRPVQQIVFFDPFRQCLLDRKSHRHQSDAVFAPSGIK